MLSASKTARHEDSDATVFHLTLGDHVHELNAAQQNAGTTKILEAEHGPSASLDGSVILLDNVIQILVLANLNRCLPLRVECVQRSQVRTAYINCHRLWRAVLVDGLSSGAELTSVRDNLWH